MVILYSEWELIIGSPVDDVLSRAGFHWYDGALSAPYGQDALGALVPVHPPVLRNPLWPQ
jgi:hypothetical protein